MHLDKEKLLKKINLTKMKNSENFKELKKVTFY